MRKAILFLAVVLFAACSEDTDPVIIDSALPNGTLSVQRAGTFIDQNGAGSAGTASIGPDTQGTVFLAFNNAFKTALGTGTVTVYLSASDTFTPDPANGNPNLLLVGPVRNAGENFFKVPTGAEIGKYSHVILWCGSVGIPFGNARLQ
ncbi:DM13 domain-containing protein [Aquiflexum sp. TKW24L]|uniref:DM13 domain-containing protein n=1 Tax=Aquiflexum sp. TKW24L TaxID=2942212 RepID=UPI0020BE5071|nr:DM13 domain-containing protein [Aquiflexum sp. TKW24L]MCL6259777.1 DM13 domain-containing protein [Aquiflexum sp. TKW24L]